VDFRVLFATALLLIGTPLRALDGCCSLAALAAGGWEECCPASAEAERSPDSCCDDEDEADGLPCDCLLAPQAAFEPGLAVSPKADAGDSPALSLFDLPGPRPTTGWVDMNTGRSLTGAFRCGSQNTPPAGILGRRLDARGVRGVLTAIAVSRT